MKEPSDRANGPARRPVDFLTGSLALALISACTVQANVPQSGDDLQTVAVDGTDVVFGFGTPAPAALIERWDIDVRPDGRGLPPGGGSVREGEALFQVRCAHCHGPTGREGPNDRLVGESFDDFPFGQSARLDRKSVV